MFDTGSSLSVACFQSTNPSVPKISGKTPFQRNPDFRSFSDAHCQVSNELYQFLQRPKFLFCPVEYCASRSVPNVKESEYLQTIGKQLEKNINVFWTGSMVVSEVITVKECQVDRYHEIFGRKNMLWLHVLKRLRVILLLLS